MQSDSIAVERRRLPFTLIETVIIEDQALGPVDILVYLALAKHADGEGTCWPSMATIGKLARCARETVARSLKHLEARGYLKRTARFRPDGGVTSNVYQLMPIEAKRYPHVAQDDTPCDPGSHPLVIVDHTNYIQSELDPRQKRESPPAPAEDPSQVQGNAGAPLPSLLRRIRQEAQRQGAPPSFIGHDFSAGIGELVKSGVPEDELMRAFTACIQTAPERVTFFPRDFLKWRKISRERRTREQRADLGRVERQARERELAKEREQILREREDPYWQAQIEAATAQLPWRRRVRR